MKYKELKKRIRNYQDMLLISNSIVYKQGEHIKMLERNLDIQDTYLIKKDEEFNVLKRMYRDDIINGDLK